MAIELREFIDETIRNVLEGVDAARSSHGDRVAPPGAATVRIDGQPAVAAHDGTFWTVINFEVTVTASEETKVAGKAGAKGGFKVLLFGSGTAEIAASAGSESASRSAQKISFAVPVRLSNKP
ncbi:MAG: hypothetical protein RLW62_17965 [Gammaproteobacteria bacterium]